MIGSWQMSDIRAQKASATTASASPDAKESQHSTDVDEEAGGEADEPGGE